MRNSYVALSLLLAVTVLVAGCKSEKEETPKGPEKVDRADPNEKVKASDADPHAGLDIDPHAGMQMDTKVDPNAAKAKSVFAFQLPKGWVDKGKKTMREVNLAVPGENESQCYVTILKGTGGGEVMNFNRWRGQMGQADLAEDKIAALSTTDLLGRQSEDDRDRWQIQGDGRRQY